MRAPERAGVFVDFDGTLAPIVEVPAEARPLPGAAEVLGRLAARFARVAVVSGRPVAFLVDHLSGGGAGAVELIGLYGMERVAAGEVAVDPAAGRWQAAVAAVAARAEAEAPAGLRVERKGLAVTLHYRERPELSGWAADFAASSAGASGLVAHPGKMSWELRPPSPTDKGTVIAGLAAGLAAVCFVGDDTGDLPAFAALARLRARGLHTMAVAVAGPETPDEVTAAADVVVPGPAGALALLEALAGA